jgi:hypothetical protein
MPRPSSRNKRTDIISPFPGTMQRNKSLGCATVWITFFLCRLPLFGAEIVGRIVDRDTRLGIGGAVIKAVPQQKNQPTVWDKAGENGKYHLELLRGKYKLLITVPNSNYLPRFYSASNQELGDVIDVPTFQSFIIINVPMDAGGSISGVIRRRLDRSPVEGVRVYAEAPGFRVSTTTNPDGSYAFGALTPDRYRVHVFPIDENYVPVYFDDALDPEQSVSLPLDRQQRITGIDFLLRYGGVISGRVYARKNREPIAGIRVLAEKQKTGTPPVYAYTDTNGFYTLRGLPDGVYTVETGGLKESTASNKSSRSRYLTQYYHDRFDRELSEKLRLNSGNSFAGIDFSLVTGGKISGTVRSRYDNRPVSSAEVVLQETATTILSAPKVTTDRDGHYQIENVPPGEYIIDTVLPKQDRRLVGVFYRDKLSFEHADKVTVEEDAWLRDIDFNLLWGATLKGQMKVDQPNYKFDAATDTITMKRISPDLDGFGERNFTINPDGSYIIEGAPPGRYRLSPRIADPNVLPIPSSEERILDLAEGDSIEGVDFAVGMGGSILGKVTTHSTAYPIEKLNLILISIKENTKTFFDLNSEEFTITGVQPGNYVLVLLSNPEKTHPNQSLQPTRVFDTRLVEVNKGKATRNVDFQIAESVERQAGILP